jgi:phosphoribosylaminoimidazolecarboxamide formyltransferase / IMP cyclohydrolase
MSSTSLAVRRALLSVSDKTGLIEAARRLVAADVALISTGGTKAALAAAGLAVSDVADLTGFPEMMDGRVKTLHPNVHGALLARRDLEDHRSAMAAHGIAGIDLLVVNLYPFEETVAAGKPFENCIENIDIGGPAMIRAAAKNFDFVAVCTDRDDLDAVLGAIEAGGVPADLRKRLAAKAFARTAAYDAAISNWFADQIGGEAPPTWRAIGGRLKQALRYGENPHQSAAVYVEGPTRFGVLTARQMQGKELSYNNIADTDAAYELIAEFPRGRPAAAIIKHANPCGTALGDTLTQAYQRALACDPVSAFGGIIAVNQRLDGGAAAEIVKIFTEVVIAPDADEEALAIFAGKKNLRLLLAGGLPDPAAPGLTVKTVAGGLLVQSRDAAVIDPRAWTIVTKRQPTPQEWADMAFAFTVCKHVKSNAIVYAKDGATAGVGAGQMNRKDSARIAALRAEEAAAAAGLPASAVIGAACASDAFFPFADGLLEAASAGATAIVQPGGSVRDAEVIAAADAHGLTMAFTGRRHFRH